MPNPATPQADALDGEPAETAAIRAPWGQLVIMFGYALVNWSIGNGLLPLLPKIAARLGADPVTVGIYLAASYVALALGTVAAGFLADRAGNRRSFMIAAMLIAAPLIALTSWATEVWELAVLTASVWCLAGMALTLVTIRAGASAAPGERGRILGFLALAAPLGSVVGGLGVGALADTVGYPTMWILLGIVVLACPLLAAGLHERPDSGRATRAPRPAVSMRWTVPFFLLIVCGVFAAFGSFVGGLGRTLAMEAAYSDTAITSTVAVSGVVALPFTILLGWMSDRVGRLPFIAACYALGALGLLVYAAAASLAMFWIAASLVGFVSYVSTGVGSALVVDLVDRPSLGRGLAYFGATGWVGAILGFGLGGVGFATLGLADAFLVAAVVTAVAVLVVGAIGVTRRRLASDRTPVRADRPEVRKE